jgi:hypothetical protein
VAGGEIKRWTVIDRDYFWDKPVRIQIIILYLTHPDGLLSGPRYFLYALYIEYWMNYEYPK